MSGIEKDLGPKGLEVLEAAINEAADVNSFVQQFKPPFPVGIATVQAAVDYIQWPAGKRVLVPMMVFIDRKGVIRAQYTGADSDFFEESKLDEHFRAEIEKLLVEPGPGPAAKAKTAKKAK